MAALPEQQVGGRGRRDPAGVGAPAPAGARVPRAQALPAHGPPHPAPRQARRGGHPAVAVGPPGGLEGRPDQGVRLIGGGRGRPRQQPRPVPAVGAPRDTEESQYTAQGPPSLRAQSLPVLALQPRREARRVSCFWVAHQLPEDLVLPLGLREPRPQRLQPRPLVVGQAPSAPLGRALRARGRHLSTALGPRPGRHHAPVAQPQHPRYVAGRPALGEEPEGLPPRLLRVPRVLLVGAGPGHPGPLALDLPALPGPLPLPERLPVRPPAGPPGAPAGQPLGPHPLQVEGLLLLRVRHGRNPPPPPRRAAPRTQGACPCVQLPAAPSFWIGSKGPDGS